MPSTLIGGSPGAGAGPGRPRRRAAEALAGKGPLGCRRAQCSWEWGCFRRWIFGHRKQETGTNMLPWPTGSPQTNYILSLFSQEFWLSAYKDPWGWTPTADKQATASRGGRAAQASASEGSGGDCCWPQSCPGILLRRRSWVAEHTLRTGASWPTETPGPSPPRLGPPCHLQ